MARRTVAAFCFPLVSNSDIMLPKKNMRAFKFFDDATKSTILFYQTRGKDLGLRRDLKEVLIKVFEML